MGPVVFYLHVRVLGVSTGCFVVFLIVFFFRVVLCVLTAAWYVVICVLSLVERRKKQQAADRLAGLKLGVPGLQFSMAQVWQYWCIFSHFLV